MAEGGSRLWTMFLVGLAVAMAGTAVYLKDTEHTKGVDTRIKVVHLVENALFYASGAWEGANRFTRFYWDAAQIRAGPGHGNLFSNDNIFSVDITIPSTWKQDEATGYTVPVRLYLPERLLNDTVAAEALPVLIYFHGGGFVFINNDHFFYDMIARDFATEGDMIVALVDYRLAPENKFPAALMDSYSVLKWVMNDREHKYADLFDRSKVAMAGDSSGAMLSLGVAMLARDRAELDGTVAAQALLYPGTYYNASTPSLEKYGDDALLLPQGMRTAKWFHDQYFDSKSNLYDLADEDDYDRELAQLPSEPVSQTSRFPVVTQPYLNPWAAESLAGLPFTHVVAAQYDPMHDENVLFHAKLVEDGVQTKLTEVEKTPHGFFVLPFLAETATTRQSIIAAFRVAFGTAE